MPEQAYHATKMMLARAANAAARAATAAEHARANLSPRADAFRLVADTLDALLREEIAVAYNEAAIPAAWRGLVVAAAVPAELGGTVEAPAEEVTTEPVAEIASDELPTGDIGDAAEVGDGSVFAEGFNPDAIADGAST